MRPVSQPLGPPSRPLRMVALGDSLTAGMQDFTLVGDRQDRSYMQVVARQVGLPFRQPEISEKGIPPRLFVGQGVPLLPLLGSYLQVGLALAAPLAALGLGRVPPEPLLWPLYHAGGMGQRTDPKEPVDNFAIPGFELRHLLDVRNVADLMGEMADRAHHPVTLAALGPYVHSILQDDGPARSGLSEVDRTIARRPDLVVLWAGNNDALEGVVAGGVVDDRTLTPLEDRAWEYHSYNPVTGRATPHHTREVHPGFRTSLDGVLSRLLGETEAHVVLMNLPDVTVVPYLKTVGEKVGPLPFRIVLPDGTDVTRWIEEWTVPSGVRGEGGDFPPGTRVGLAMLLTKLAEMAPSGKAEEFFERVQGLGSQVFTQDEVLDPGEIRRIQERTAQYNALLQEAARNPRVHLVDIHGLLNEARDAGVPLRGAGEEVRATSTYTGLQDARGFEGIFSYDGIHPSDVGHAVIANRVMEKVARDLGGDPRFRPFADAAPADEKAALRDDPHRRRENPVFVLRPSVGDSPLTTRRT